jgi:hypothetical protein
MILQAHPNVKELGAGAVTIEKLTTSKNQELAPV